MYGCKSWTIKKAERQRIDAFELWCWRRLESPLNCKEIQPVHPKGNQSWILIGKTDVEAETPIICPPDAKSQSFEKTLVLGLWMASLTQWTWVGVDSRSWWWTGRPGVLRFMRWQSQTRLNHWTKLNWTEWSSGFVHFLLFQSESGNKEFMIWATVSSWSCFCWLYRASPSLAAKNIINLISVSTIWWCPCADSSLVLLE